jgi:hypothetical protein
MGDKRIIMQMDTDPKSPRQPGDNIQIMEQLCLPFTGPVKKSILKVCSRLRTNEREQHMEPDHYVDGRVCHATLCVLFHVMGQPQPLDADAGCQCARF